MLFREGETRPWVVLGSMGGDIQPQIHLQLVSALVDGGGTVADAVAVPRWAVEAAAAVAPPLAVSVESRVDATIVAELERRGHRVAVGEAFDAGFGHAHAIELVDGGPAVGGTLAAATDPRSAGLPAVR
jgi:gamma-glutamyltranspeptidase/glutathione hydrolase